ncbi:DHH family phosphoesterase [Pseudogracilibacillus sp. SE30717A]|uniref:DHH family phosphoesterase n=1 Tax=Pseudogracilibacillus sp. SE30717A TaxID=3098293 RepID=UPI00300E453D
MLEHYERTIRNNYIWATYVLSFLMTGVLFYFQWLIGAFFLILLCISFYYNKREEKRINKQQLKYLSKLSYQVENAGKKVFINMPIGIIIYDDDYTIKWINPFIFKINDRQDVLGKTLDFFSDDLINQIKSEKEEVWLTINHLQFKTKIDRINQTLFLFNRTEEKQLEKLYKDEQVVLATIYLDNYEEISRNMSDNLKSKLNSEVTAKLNKWADDYHFYIKRTSQDRFVAVLTQETLLLLEKSRFEILDEIRSLNMEEVQRNPITLSIGIGTGNVPIPELAKLSQSSLDLALGRGGDQIAIRDETGKVRFFGGKTNPMEKRTRIRARVISHALKELVKESDNVLIMGHKAPDMDSLGSTIGVLNIANSNDVEGYIVFDENDVTTGVSKVIEKVKQEEGLWKHFIGPEEAEAIYTSRSLVVVVDTHRPSLVAHEKLIRNAEYKVVIDHHRRGEEFIANPTLVYMEPYASSTAELVTELIEYQPNKKKLSTIEATSLLAGIIVDTKSFALRTGSRTFDAASYLRSKGADPVLIQKFLKEDLDTLIKRNKLIERAYIFHDSLAIVKADDQYYNQILIAQTADALLTVDRVNASFVIARRSEDVVSISARSLGEVNVQIIMEEMNGGGHLTNAATQIKDKSIDEVENELREKINSYFEGRT